MDNKQIKKRQMIDIIEIVLLLIASLIFIVLSLLTIFGVIPQTFSIEVNNIFNIISIICIYVIVCGVILCGTLYIILHKKERYRVIVEKMIYIEYKIVPILFSITAISMNVPVFVWLIAVLISLSFTICQINDEIRERLEE